MPRQHHYPAVLTGQFGVPAEGRRRQRNRQNVVWMARRDSTEPREVAAESIGWSNAHRNLYDFSEVGLLGATIDPLWSHAEGRVPEIVQALRRYRQADGLDIELYLRGLIPLAAQLMVRHPEFEERIRGRLERQDIFTGKTSREPTSLDINIGRSVEYLCLCGLLASRRCAVVQSTHPLVGSELGYSGMLRALGPVPDGYVYEPSDEPDGLVASGYVFPLSRNVAVQFTTGEPPALDGARVELERLGFDQDDAEMTNVGTAGWSPASIFGDRRSVVRAARVWEEQEERSPYSDIVPIFLTGPSSINSGMAEHFLRLLHSVQLAVERDSDQVGFDDCATCPVVLGQVRAVIG